MKKIFTLLFFATFFAAAQETDILPSAFPASRYVSIWENSPFNREVAARITVQDQSSFAANIVLEGLVTDQNEGSIAYLRDLKENTFLIVKSKKSETSPLFIVDASKSANPAETTVTISDGVETAEIKYADGVYTQKIDAPPAAPEKETVATERQENRPAVQPAPPASGGPPGVTDSAPPGMEQVDRPNANNSGPPLDGAPPTNSRTSRGILLPPNSNRPPAN